MHAALSFDATYGPRYGILVLDAIEKALSDRTLDSASAFTQSNAWTLKPGAAVAWAPHPALGVVASADYQWVSLDVVGGPRQTESGIDAAVAADVDLGYWTRAPLALLGAWHTTAPIGSNGVSRVNDWSGGVYYTGRPALALGLQIGWRSFKVRELDSDATVAQVRVQYFW